MNRYKSRVCIICLLLLVLTFGMVGCKKKEEKAKKEEPTKKVEATEKPVEGELAKYRTNNLNFSIQLLKSTYNIRQNSIYAPMAVQMSLGALLNGAQSGTQQALIQTLGMESIVYNEYIKAYLESLNAGSNEKLEYNTTIWFNNVTGLMDVNSNYDARVKTYLKANMEMLAFSRYTKDTINMWIEQETDGFINEVYNKTNTSDVMYTTSASDFSMNWDKLYNTSDIAPGQFTNFDGTIKNVEMMTSKENIYLEDNDASGFVKNFKDGRYQFIALVPDASINIYKYVAGMTADKLSKILDNAIKEETTVTIPKFSAIKVQNMFVPFSKIGLKQLYSEYADYRGILKNGNNLYLGASLHKARIEIGKTGVQGAGVATVSNVNSGELKISNRAVVLDRPFLYMIYDSVQCVPVYMGVQQYM